MMMYTDKDVWHILYPEHKAIEDTDASAELKHHKGMPCGLKYPTKKDQI